MGDCNQSRQNMFDIRRGSTCVDICTQLLQAYYNVIGGHQRTEVRYNERWISYNKGNAAELRDNYMLMFAQCAAARQAGLPDLNPAKIVRRGPAARAGFPFPRLGGEFTY